MIEAFPGKGPSSRPLATGYLINGKVAIDAPEGVLYPNPECTILTHEHCDHIVGISSNRCKVHASPEAAKAIDAGNTFCDELGLPGPKGIPIRSLKDGERLQFPNFSLRILHTPGHSPGSMCIYLEEKGFLFCGDTVFPDLMLPNLSLPRSGPSQLLRSYEKLSELKIEKFFPGHGNPFSAPGYMEQLKEALSALLH
ncbi:MAG: MBL fold metallo-hydrolase [Candidatus Micrarchaeota archaeon]